MNITIYGCGYVGLITGACLAELGHHVLCIDIDPNKIALLKNGEVTLYEPGLDELLLKNLAKGNLIFSLDAQEGLAHATVQFIAVNTPSLPSGAANTSHIFEVAQNIAENMQDYKLIINKSTAPVGTVAKIKDLFHQIAKKRNRDLQFDVASNPEFLKEGCAVADFMHPDRIIVGCDSQRGLTLLRELYRSFNTPIHRLMEMDIPSAELTKYAANSLLATKISFINEIANLAEYLGADIEQVRRGISSDPRIGPHFIAPGCGYGGSCFPKDVQALIHTAKESGLTPHLLSAVEKVNHQQKQKLFVKLHQHFQGNLQDKKFALWGLAFKPHTNDMREASSRTLLEALWQAGAQVQAYDPVAIPEAIRIYGEREDLNLCTSKTECLEGADALIIVTEWPEFQEIDLEIIRETLVYPVIFDGRNIFDPNMANALGIHYYGIGRGSNAVVHQTQGCMVDE